MNKKVRFIIFFVVLVFGLAVQTASGAEAPIVIKFAHQAPVNDPMSKEVQYFAKEVAERTRGRVKEDVYPAGILYKDSEITPAVKDGAIQMGFFTFPMLESFIPI